MDNMISINVPKNVAENLHGILHAGMTVGQALTEVPDTETAAGKQDFGVGKGLRKILANAGFSESEREAIFASLHLPKRKKTG